MIPILSALKSLPRRGQHNFVKILCLALGLAVSSVIIAEIYFEQTFDTWFEDWQRTYVVEETAKIGNEEPATYTQTPGAIAPGLKRYCPMVEAATRITWFESGARCNVSNNYYTGNIVFADSCFFDVFRHPVSVGDTKSALAQEQSCMVSRSLAEAIGGNVVGQKMTIATMPNVPLTINGVFDDFPWNSSIHQVNVLLSMSSLKYFMYDGTDNWVGNDRYESFVRLAKGHDSAELTPFVNRMIAENLPVAELKKAGVEMTFDVEQLSESYTNDPYIKKMGWMMGIVAFVLLFTSVMNYLLIVIGNMVSRSSEMAVRRCYGAAVRNIHAIVLTEAAVHVVIAILLAAAMVFACKGTVEEMLSAPLSTLLLNKGSWILVVICLFIILLGGVVPGWLYSRIPVTAAFRGYNENRRRWKVALLAVQFVVSGLLFSLLYVVSGQYDMMVATNPGYDYQNTAILSVNGSSREQRAQLLGELRRLPEVKMVSSAYGIPIMGYGFSGNNVTLPGDDRELFNAADMYGVGDGYFDLMGIKIKRGSFFTERNDTSRQVMVSEDFAQRLQKAAGWKDGVVGKRIFVSEHCDEQHPTVTICGVFSNFKMGNFSAAEAQFLSRPVMFFYERQPEGYILVKFHNLTAEAMEAVREKSEAIFPNLETNLVAFSNELKGQYVSQLHFRNAVLVGGIITLLIALIGLVGYTADEVNRRRKEIAIRKVNGARTSDVLRLFLRGILVLAIPSVIVGTVAAWLVGRQWLMSFSVKFAINPFVLIFIVILLLAVIALAVAINCRKVANGNPVLYLKDE